MASYTSHSHSHSTYTHSTRDHFREPPSILRRLLLLLPTDLAVYLQRMVDQGVLGGRTSRIPRYMRGWITGWSWRRVFSLPHLLVCVWVVALLYGERWVFKDAVKACAWEEWERWVGFLLLELGGNSLLWTRLMIYAMR